VANFEWLNDIPDEHWEKADGGGLRRFFSLSWFVRKSEADPNSWRGEFDAWKFGTERVYESFHCPPSAEGIPLVMITVGFRNA